MRTERILRLPSAQAWLTELHPLNPFELAHGAIKGAFVLFSTILVGLVGLVLQNWSFLPHEMAS